MNKTFTLFGLDRSDRKVFYTGRAGLVGSNWLSPNQSDAFTYPTYESAKAAADRHNKWTDLHGIHFVADCGE